MESKIIDSAARAVFVIDLLKFYRAQRFRITHKELPPFVFGGIGCRKGRKKIATIHLSNKPFSSVAIFLCERVRWRFATKIIFGTPPKINGGNFYVMRS